jgi:hypothetical protein
MLPVKYVRPEAWHIVHIATNMRQEDRQELDAGGWDSPEVALSASLDASEWAAVALVDGEPVAVFGVAIAGPLLCRTYIPWLLGATTLHTLSREIMVESKHVVYDLMNEYPRLENWVYAGSINSIRWLRRLGFTVENETVQGPRGAFRHFHWSRDNV